MSRWLKFKWAPCQAATILRITGLHLNSAAELLTTMAGKNRDYVCSARQRNRQDCCHKVKPGYIAVSGRYKPSKS